MEKDKMQIEKEKLQIERDKLGVDNMKVALDKNRGDLDIAKQKYDMAVLEIEKDRRKADSDRFVIEREKIRLDKETHDMATNKEIISLLEKKGELLLNTLSANMEIADLQKRQKAFISGDGIIIDTEKYDEFSRNLAKLDFRLQNYKKEFLAVESKLAKIEDRPIQNLETYFPTPSPPQLK